MKRFILPALLLLNLFVHADNPGNFNCGNVYGLTHSVISNNAVTLNWYQVTAALSYDVDYKIQGSSTWINAGSTPSLSIQLNGLNAATLYDWRIRSVCGAGAGNYSFSQFATSSTAISCSNCYVPPQPPPPPPSLAYNTTFTSGGSIWNAKIHLPWDYNISSQDYPAIIFFPGIGEVGTDINKLLVYGPHKYLAGGWNGNVKIDNDSVKFIIISLQPDVAYPHEALINAKISEAKSFFRIQDGKINLTGLSHGGWCSTTFVTGDNYGGPYNFAAQISSVVEVQGIKPDDNQPYPDRFDNFALAGGRLLGFEQSLDGRDMPARVNRMNNTVANSAIYIQTNYNGGGHCCFDNYYGSSSAPQTFILDGRTENIYQWMARQ